MHPPRPRLTVRVGVAGHRWNKLQRQNTEAIRERLNQVFDSIEDVVDQVLADPAAGYLDPESADPPPSAVLRVLSGLAEGTDRLGAQVASARDRKWLLTALLPYPRDKYVLDFKMKKELPDGTAVRCREGEFGYDQPDTASVQEFEELRLAAEGEGGVQELDGAAGKHGAYRQLATALCLNSDVVVAVWDGTPGGPGGTGDIIRLAGDYGIPVVRIPTDGVGNPWLHDPGHHAEKDDAARRLGLRSLAEHFRRLLVAPKPSPEDEKEEDNPRESYFRERVRSKNAGRIYDLFFNFLSPKGPSGPPAVTPALRVAPDEPSVPVRGEDAEPEHLTRLRRRWVRDWTEQGASYALCTALTRTGVHRHYAWASHLANYNGGRYRSAFLLNYMLAWLAVTAAAAGIAFEQAGNHSLVQAAAISEVFILGFVMAIVWYTGRHRFHSQWLDCRRLAEWIRLLPMLLPLSRTPVLGVESNPGLSSQESWVDWMFRAVVREAGILSLDVGQHLEGAQGILAAGILEGQIDYHARTARRNERVDAILHGITKGAFGLALVISLYHLLKVLGVDWPVPETVERVLLVLNLAIPAFGGAMHGLRSQGDYEATAIRSRRIKERLVELRQELRELPAPTVGGIAEIAVKTASVMNAELSAWLVAYQSKAISAA